MKLLLSLGIAILLFVSVGLGQSTFNSDVSRAGTNAASFLEIPVGPAAIGMGSAYVSVANDATSLYWNPAGITSVPSNDFVAVHMNWIADTKFDFGGFVLPMGDVGTLGFSLTSLTMADMMVRTVAQPDGTGAYFSASDLAIGVTYSRKLTERFSVGFTGKYIQESIWDESASAFALDIGTSFRTELFGGMTIGATLSNFGTSMRLSGADARYFISVDPTNAGANNEIPTDIEMDSWNLPLLFQLGVSTSVVKNDDYHWIVAMDALHPSDDYESMNFGTAVTYRDFLTLRGGYESLFLPDAEGGMSFGIGVGSQEMITGLGFNIDYGFRDMGRLSSVQTFSLDLRF
jgi:hypothetical protein